MNVYEFVAKHGFPGTPAGDRMLADAIEMIDENTDEVRSWG